MRKRPILTNEIPAAFKVWFKEMQKRYPYVTIEISRNEVVVVRTREPVKNEDIVEGLAFGKFIVDGSGCYLERTFRPRYYPDKDCVLDY